MSDIRTNSATGADYDPNPAGPDGSLVVKWRLSDVDDATGRPGTTIDFDFPVDVDCVRTDDATVGSTCSASAAANSVAPGSFIYGQQAVLQTFRVRVTDSGPDGVHGNGDDRNFAQQGIFIP
jgi:hypothetical protein